MRRPTRSSALTAAWAVLVSNIVIIVTGALVRLTASGLGCPTWPQCTNESFVPHRELGVHGVIEFGNRLLTYVLVAVSLYACVVIWRWTDSQARDRRLIVWLALGIPFQGVIGGITVLTNLNPWIVAFHLVLSLVLVAGATVLVAWIRNDHRSSGLPSRVRTLTWLVYANMWVIVYLGTIVTGSGPHAGDLDSPRNGLDPGVMSHIHAWAVYLLVGLTLALIWFSRDTPLFGLATALLVVELAQGLIGFVQYFTNLPIALVAAHLLGAAILIVVTTRVVMVSQGSTSLPYRNGSTAAATKSSAK